MDETHIVNINKLKHNFQSLLKLQKNITDVRATAHKKLQESVVILFVCFLFSIQNIYT